MVKRAITCRYCGLQTWQGDHACDRLPDLRAITKGLRNRPVGPMRTDLPPPTLPPGAIDHRYESDDANAETGCEHLFRCVRCGAEQ